MAHATKDELEEKLKKTRRRVEVGGLYYHYKAPEKYYVVEFLGFLEENQEVCVGYRALYDKGILWVRTIEKFLGKVELGNGGKAPRFTKVQSQ